MYPTYPYQGYPRIFGNVSSWSSISERVWPASMFYLGMAVAWMVVGGIATFVYRTYLHKRYPPKKFGIGFTFYLLERGTDSCAPSTFLERVAGWHTVVNLTLPFKPKFWRRHVLHDLFNLVFWPGTIVQLYMYRKFAQEIDKELAKIS